MSMLSGALVSMSNSRSGPVTQSRPIRVQNSWAAKRCMNYRQPGKRPALCSHRPGAARNNYHIQAENEANTVKGRTKRRWERVLMIVFVPLIKPYLNLELFRHMKPKPSFFAKPCIQIFIYWFGRERKRKREKRRFVVPLIYAFSDWFLCVSWPWSNPQPWHTGTML